MSGAACKFCGKTTGVLYGSKGWSCRSCTSPLCEAIVAAEKVAAEKAATTEKALAAYLVARVEALMTDRMAAADDKWERALSKIDDTVAERERTFEIRMEGYHAQAAATALELKADVACPAKWPPCPAKWPPCPRGTVAMTATRRRWGSCTPPSYGWAPSCPT